MTSSLDIYEEWAEKTRMSAEFGVSLHYYDLAGVTICIRLHDKSLESPFLRAITHLKVEEGQAKYVIDVWDCKRNNLSFPKFNYGVDDVKLRGEIPNYSGSGISFAYFSHARMVHILNENKHHGIVALVDARQLPVFELACPFRAIFSWILRNNSRAMIHGAALADNNGDGYLILGKSGAGKSTSAISCFISGMKYIGDDLCAIGMLDNEIYVFSLYSSGKTYYSECEFLPLLSKYASSLKDKYFPKEIYFFGEEHQRICHSARIKKILIPSKNKECYSNDSFSVAALMSMTITSTQELLPNAGFELLPLLSKAFKQAEISVMPLHEDRRCPLITQHPKIQNKSWEKV